MVIMKSCRLRKNDHMCAVANVICGASSDDLAFKLA